MSDHARTSLPSCTRMHNDVSSLQGCLRGQPAIWRLAVQKVHTHSSFMHSFIAIFSARQLHTTAHMPCFCVHSPKSRISGAHACAMHAAAERDGQLTARSAADIGGRSRTSVASFFRCS